jgi:hypothetical protein
LKLNSKKIKDEEGKQLPTSAKVGIGISVICSLFIIAMFAMFIRAKRNKSSFNVSQEFQKAELEDNSKEVRDKIPYLIGMQRIELDAYGDGIRPAELEVRETHEVDIESSRYEIGVDVESAESSADTDRNRLELLADTDGKCASK